MAGEPVTVTTRPASRAWIGISTDFVVPWIVKSPVAVAETTWPSAGIAPRSIGFAGLEVPLWEVSVRLCELHRRVRVGVVLERLAVELAVALGAVALERGEVAREVRRADGRA